MASSNPPRYRQLTTTLRAAIVSGKYPVGSLLPTEVEICGHFGVSRHTVRDALRLLSAAGLIQRRRRVGTVVIARTETPEFIQPLPGLDEVLQYGHDVRLAIASYDTSFACPLTKKLGLDPKDWLRIDGRRGPEHRLLGLTTAVIRRDLAPSRSELEKSETSLGELIERSTGIVVERIDQEISAIALDRRAAKALDLEPGAPALRARRLYYEKDGSLFVATESIHPGDRFSYTMTFNRSGSDDGRKNG